MASFELEQRFTYRIEAHSSSSQRVVGQLLAKGVSREEVERRVKGTFGGRFVKWAPGTDAPGTFEYIAYTD